MTRIKIFQLIALPAFLTVLAIPSLSMAQDQDLSGYWIIEEDEKYPKDMPRLLRFSKKNWMGSQKEALVWIAEFTRPANCPNGTATLPYYFQRSPYGPGGDIARCSKKEFMDTCEHSINRLPDHDPKDFYYVHVPDMKIKTSRKAKTISGTYKSEFWRTYESTPGECERVPEEDDVVDFELKLTSCPARLTMVEPTAYETNVVDEALVEWLKEKEEESERTLEGLRETSQIVDGIMRADAARCIPREVIDATMKLTKTSSYNDCTAMCFHMDTWFKEIAGDKTQHVPLADFRSRCIAQICTRTKAPD